MTELEQIDDRKFTINFGPQHPAAHGVLRLGLSRLTASVLALFLGLFISLSASAQMQMAVQKTIDDYVGANIHNYYLDMSSSEILDCLAVEIAMDQIVAKDGPEAARERTKQSKELGVDRDTWQRALEKSGVVSDQQINNMLPDTRVAKVIYGQDMFAIKFPEGFDDDMKSQMSACHAAILTALNNISEFMQGNYDIVFAPPADNPYLVDRGNESLRGLFKSIVEYPPADARITAQRCFMIPAYANTRVIGSLHGREAPAIDSLKFGYEIYEEFDSDIQAIYTHFSAVLETMPSDPMSNHEAIDQPRNETSSIIRTGTSIQEEMFSTAIVKAMPDCVSRARAGLSKGSGK